MFFTNRREAGVKLAGALEKYKSEGTVVLGIPRGGVVAAAEVARILDAPLDIIVPRKIGAPHNPEVAIGAVTQDGTVIKDEQAIKLLGLTDTQVDRIAKGVAEEITRRVNVYRGGRQALDLKGTTVIIIDDGIATGFTVQAALKSVRNMDPRQMILAVPVAPADTIKMLCSLVDDLVCLQAPDLFYAVGQFYIDFDQTGDREVIDLLAKYSGKPSPISSG